MSKLWTPQQQKDWQTRINKFELDIDELIWKTFYDFPIQMLPDPYYTLTVASMIINTIGRLKRAKTQVQ